ncbi:MAG: molecular chaperone DnaJ [Gammaproteobacteria bacterium]|nr:molecular chaperone DnaJ [Gammaproteobacteria bacterium]
MAAVLAGTYFLVRWLRRSVGGPKLGRIVLAVGVIGFLSLLTVRGGAEIALPLLVALAPFLLRWLNVWTPPSPASADASSSGQSAVTTRFLHMVLHHADGAMIGQVREGGFAGRALHDLTLVEWLVLWQECQVDPQSVAVLEAYLDHYAGPDWRERLHASSEHPAPFPSGGMTRSEAYQILGLSPGVGREDVQAAYRRLIQRVHPDQGGSAYLAAQLNRARDLLLAGGFD